MYRVINVQVQRQPWGVVSRMVTFPDGFFPERRFRVVIFPDDHFPRMRRFPERLREW